MAWSPDHATGPTEGLQQLPPPANLLDRVFAGLDFDPLAPRAGRLAGVGLALQLGGTTYQGDGTSPLSVTDSSPRGATTASAPPAESDEGGGGGGGGDEPVATEEPRERQINWEAVAIAYAENNGSLKLIDGEVDITAALTDLAKALTDRAESVGMGEAKRQIIGENPTVDLYINDGAESEFGSGESMAMSGGSGSGCGQSQGSNQAPVAYDDEFVVSAIQPTTIDNNGVLWNDQTQPNETLTAILSTAAQPGSVNLNPGGGFTYTPPVPPQGNDTFFYQAFDAVLYSCPAKVSLGMPLVDLDTDSDNNGVVNQSPWEEAIEMTNPGNVVAYNKDDDNSNGLPDYQDSTAPLGDNDLVHAKYTTTPTGILDPTGYKFKLIVDEPSRIKVWKNPQKDTMPLTWTHGDAGAPPLTGDFYVEGLAKGAATVEYQMLKPDDELLHSDKVKFTVVDADLDVDSDNNGPIDGSDFEENIEMDAPGKMVRHNRDDDNANTDQDRLDPAPFVNGQGVEMNDDDLVPVAVVVDSGGVALTNWTATLTPSNAAIKVWKTQSKQSFSSLTFTLGGGANPVPNTVWVEGFLTGQSTLLMTLKRPNASTFWTDEVLFTTMFVDLIAYRPQTEGPGYGEPFPRIPLPANLETSPGAGIRVNGDDDDGNGTADRNDAGPVDGENDLIELQMVIDPPAPIPGLHLVMNRSNNAIRVWDESNRSGSLLNSATWLIQNNLDGQFWVEWKGAATTANSTLKLEARAINSNNAPPQQADSIKFYPFRGVVVAFGGNGNNPLDPTDGAFQIAVQLYNEGYDVHAYRENPTSNAHAEVVNATTNRGVTDVGIFGWSQGGGATYVLAASLNSVGVLADFTGYLDAIRHTLGAAEVRYPPGSAYHFNYWQSNPNVGIDFNGAATTVGGTADIDLDVTTTIWGATLDHYSIAPDLTVQAALKSALKANVAK